MKESERIERELVKYKEKSEEFRQQLQSFRKFKEELVKAGVYREDSYTVPLMLRRPCRPDASSASVSPQHRAAGYRFS